MKLTKKVAELLVVKDKLWDLNLVQGINTTTFTHVEVMAAHIEANMLTVRSTIKGTGNEVCIDFGRVSLFVETDDSQPLAGIPGEQAN